MGRIVGIVGLVALVAMLGLAGPARAETPRPNVAALQSALDVLGFYEGHVDGLPGPMTRRAIVGFQRSRGLAANGRPGPETRRALGWRGGPAMGSRVIRIGMRGWDVAGLQYLLQRAGFGAGRVDGVFGPLTRQAVARAQRSGQTTVDGLVGRETLVFLRRDGALRSGEGGGQRTVNVAHRSPVAFQRPVNGPIGDGFGVRRGPNRVHQGVDYPLPQGTPVVASAPGTVIFAGYNTGGYGNLVVIQHRHGYTTWYAHFAKVTVANGARVRAGARVGLVGSTGNSTGPHLHFEIRHYDTPIDPLPLLLPGAVAQAIGHDEHHHGEYGECEDHDHAHGNEHDSSRHATDPPRRGSWIARERLCHSH